MNMLNNIIFEGVVSVGISDKGIFIVTQERSEKVGETIVTTKINVTCVVKGAMMLESSMKYMKEGQGVRIVGHLESMPNGNGIGICAEHIEYKFCSKVHKEGKYNFVQD